MDGRSTPIYMGAHVPSGPESNGSDTALKLKSFINQNLYTEGSTSFIDSSPTETEVKLIGTGSGGSYRVDTETPEPQPLTTSNVTIHDRIWSKDSPRSSMEREIVRKDLSPPLKGLGIGEETFWKKAMNPLSSLSDTESEHSYSSQDTMIMMTSESGRRIKQSLSNDAIVHSLYNDDNNGVNCGTTLKRKWSLKELGRQKAMNDFTPNKASEMESSALLEARNISCPQGAEASVASANNMVDEMLRVEVEEAPSMSRSEDQDDGYESIDNLSSGTSSSNSSTCSPTSGSPSVCSPDSQVPRGGQYLTVAPVLRDPMNFQPSVSGASYYGRASPLPSNYDMDKPQEVLKTSYGYVNTSKVPSFRSMNEALRRKSNPDQTTRNKRDTFQEKLQALTLADNAGQGPQHIEDSDAIPSSGSSNTNGKYYVSSKASYQSGGLSNAQLGQLPSGSVYNKQLVPPETSLRDTPSPSSSQQGLSEPLIRYPLRTILKDSSSSSGSLDTTDGFPMDSLQKKLKKKSVSFRIPEEDHSDTSSSDDSDSIEYIDKDPEMDQETGESSASANVLGSEEGRMENDFRLSEQNVSSGYGESEPYHNADRVDYSDNHYPYRQNEHNVYGEHTFPPSQNRQPSRQEGSISQASGDLPRHPSPGEDPVYSSLPTGNPYSSPQEGFHIKNENQMNNYTGTRSDSNHQSGNPDLSAHHSSKSGIQVVLSRTPVLEEDNKPYYSRTVLLSEDTNKGPKEDTQDQISVNLPYANKKQGVYRPPTPPGDVRASPMPDDMLTSGAASRFSYSEKEQQAMLHQSKYAASVKNKLDKEKSQYMELLEQFKRGQRQSSPTGSVQENTGRGPHVTGVVRSNSLNIVRHPSPQSSAGSEESLSSTGKPKFVRTADIYKMLEERRRGPEGDRSLVTSRVSPPRGSERSQPNSRPVRATWGPSSGEQLYDRAAPLRATYTPPREQLTGSDNVYNVPPREQMTDPIYQGRQVPHMVPRPEYHGSLDRQQGHRPMSTDVTRELGKYPVTFIHRNAEGFFEN